MGQSLAAAHSLGRALRLRRRPHLEVVPDEEPRGLRAFLYDAEGTDRSVSLEELVVEQLTDTQLLWIDVPDVEDVSRVAAALGLAEETVAAIRGPSSEPVVFVQDGYVHIAVVAPEEGPVGHDPRPLHCLVSSNWVVTVHPKPIEFLADFDARIRTNSDLGRIDGQGFLAAILQEHVANYLAELRPIEAELDRIDVRSMTGRMNEDALLRELVGTRLRLAKLRRLLEPHRELFARLARSEFAVLSGSESVAEFETLTEFLERALQSMESTREMIQGSFEIYTTWAAHGTNQVMKRLTIASLTLLPPTLLAGVMGMNSLPAQLTVPAAFWSSTAAMVSLAAIVLTLARLRSWI
jgi:magnesium transporter